MTTWRSIQKQTWRSSETLKRWSEVRRRTCRWNCDTQVFGCCTLLSPIVDVRIVYLGILSCNLCEEEWFVVGLPPHLGKGRHWIFYVRVICVGATDGGDNWRWIFDIMSVFYGATVPSVWSAPLLGLQACLTVNYPPGLKGSDICTPMRRTESWMALSLGVLGKSCWWLGAPDGVVATPLHNRTA